MVFFFITKGDFPPMTPRFDLNLLTVLHVLLEERSVTRTGDRLGRTQSAISNALKRLRTLFDDPLVVRGADGLSPTPRALDLAPVIARIVAEATACVTPPEGFDPATAQAQFAIGAPDRFALPLFLPLFAQLRRVAPGIVPNLRTTDRTYAIRLIEAGEIDLAIGWFDHIPSQLASRFAFEDRLACLCRADHPLLAGGHEPTLDAILAAPHLVVSSTGDRRAAFDAMLHQQGLRRTIAATLTSFTAVPDLLCASDMVGVFTRRTCDHFVARHPLRAVPLQLDLSPLANHLIWQRRFDSDPAHVWLRTQILNATRDSPAPARP